MPHKVDAAIWPLFISKTCDFLSLRERDIFILPNTFYYHRT